MRTLSNRVVAAAVLFLALMWLGHEGLSQTTIVNSFPAPLSGSLGGTGAATAEAARVNLNALPAFDVRDPAFGAKCDFLSKTGGSVASGSTSFNGGAYSFVAADVGKHITVPGGGTGGVPLVTTISAVPSGLATLAGAAGAPVSSSVSNATDWAVAVAGNGVNSYVPGDTITLTGGTSTAATVVTVKYTTVMGTPTIAAAGSGGTNGTYNVTGTTGTGTYFVANITVAGGAVTAVNSVSETGKYSVNPTSIAAEPIAAAAPSVTVPTGAQLGLKMGVWAVAITTPGAYTAAPSNPVAQGSTSGSGVGATFTMTYTAGGAYSFGTDDAAAFNAAQTAVSASGAPGVLQVPGGTCLVSTSVIAKNNVYLNGSGRGNGNTTGNTVLMLRANACTDVVATDGAYSLFGTNSASGPVNWGLANLTLDGNKAQQFGCTDPDAVNGIAQYGSAFTWDNLVVRNVLGNGVRSEWTQFGGAGTIIVRHLWATNIGRHGIWWKGPHDGSLTDTAERDASQEADDVFSGLYLAPYGGSNFTTNHAWHSSVAIVRRMHAGVSSSGSSRFVNSDFEGSHIGYEARAGATGDLIVNGRFYYPTTDANGALVKLGGTRTVITGSSFNCNPLTGSTPYAVQLGIGTALSQHQTITGNTYLNCPVTYNVVNDAGNGNLEGLRTGVAQIPDSLVYGGNARGTYAVDLSMDRFQNNQVASGSHATVAGGYANVAAGNYASVGGGNGNVASGVYTAISGGFSSSDRGSSSQAYASGNFGVGIGADAQIRNFVLRCTTSTGSACRMTADQAAASSVNCLNIPNNTAYHVAVSLIGLDNTTPANSLVWNMPVGILARGANAASTTWTGVTPTIIENGTVTGWGMTIGADTTNGCLNLSATPPTSNTDKWNYVARVQTTEVQ